MSICSCYYSRQKDTFFFCKKEYAFCFLTYSWQLDYVQSSLS
jgi:hypothetical protein